MSKKRLDDLAEAMELTMPFYCLMCMFFIFGQVIQRM